MQNLKNFFIVLTFFFSINGTYSQKSPVVMQGTEVIKFKSLVNNKDYILDVYLPAAYGNKEKRFPVLYVLDGQWSFTYIGGIQGIAEGLFYDGLIPEMIVVGIKWPGDYEANRQFDFTPGPMFGFSKTGGAGKFLTLMEKEIMKKINSNYRTDTSNSVLTGGSLGAHFTLYTLFQKPTLFSRYIAWGISGNEEMLQMEKSFSEKNKILNAKLFVCTNTYEEEMINNSAYKKFMAQLTEHNYQGFEADSLTIDKMGHVSEGPYAVGRGLEFVFSQTAIAVDTLLLEQYSGHYKHEDEIMTVDRIGSHIYIIFPGGKLKLYAKTSDSFYVKGYDGGIGQFVKDSSGAVTGYRIILDNAIIPYKKID